MIMFRLLVVTIAFASSLVYSQQYLSRDEALAMYVGPSPDRKTVFLTDEQLQTVQQRAKAKVESKIVTYYTGNNRYAFFESRTIRTMPATFMVVLNSHGAVHSVEMMAFYEPEDYLPPKKWMATFKEKTIKDDLWLKRGVYNISGASLSAQAITESIRKILAVYSIVVAKDTP